MIVPTTQAQPRPKMATDQKRSPAKVQMMTESVPSQEMIRERAYELYESRGREHGQDEQDWLRAEQEIVNGQRPKNPPPR